MADELSRELDGMHGKVTNGKTAKGLTVKVDVDVSEALTGLKAVTREAKTAQKALRELEVESGKVAAVNDMRDIQGQPGNYDVSEYMTGLYNGLELASATLEGREPEYRVKPIPDFAELVSNHYPITYEDANVILNGIMEGCKVHMIAALK